MTSTTTRVVGSLDAFPTETVDAVCAGAGPLLGARWFRLIESLDLAMLLGAAVELRYVVAMQDGVLVALCPLLVVRSAAVPFVYSLDKYFFTAWHGELASMAPEYARFIPWLVRGVLGFRRALHLAGVRTDAWLLAMSPLSFRGGIVVHPAQKDHAALRSLILDTLKEMARDEALPLCMFGVQARDTENRTALARAGFDEQFLYPDMVIEVPRGGLAEYLSRFRSDERRRLKGEIAAARKLGVEFKRTADFRGLADTFAVQYANTYDRYAADHIRAPASFWSALGETLGEEAAAAVAWQGETPLGFVAELTRDQEQFEYRVGRVYTPEAERAAVYFNLMFFGAIERAAERGVRRLWLGPNSWEAKHRRGAVPHPLYLHWWLPKWTQRALLAPYLRLFSQVTRKQLASYERPTSGLKAEAAEQARRLMHEGEAD